MSTTTTPAPTETQATPAPASTPASTPAAAGTTPAPTTTPAPEASSTPAPGATPAPGTTPAPAPMAYALKAPEGSKLGTSAIERTTANVAKWGLSAETAQSVLEHVHGEVAEFWKAQEAESAQLRNVDWVQQTKADPEIGGAKFDETVRAAALARQAYFTPAFDKMLNDSGLGNHPEFVRAWSRVGKSMSEGQLINPNQINTPPPRKSTAEVMYGAERQPA